MRYGEVLRRGRRTRGHTQPQAAEWVGVSARTWRRWESEAHYPQPSQVERLAEYCRVDPGELVALEVRP